jgi:hypothetical protein
LTVAEKLAEIDRLIEHYRFARRWPEEPEYKTYVTLKAVAADLRARMDGKAETTRRTLGAKVAAAARAADDHSEIFALAVVELGKDLIGHWATVEQALEQYERTHATP